MALCCSSPQQGIVDENVNGTVKHLTCPDIFNARCQFSPPLIKGEPLSQLRDSFVGSVRFARLPLV